MLKITHIALFCGSLWLSLGAPTQAQTGQKPSYYGNLKRAAQMPPLAAAETEVKTDRNSAAVLKNKAEFSLLARVYERGTPFEIPHVLFVIDRAKGNQIHYVNTPKHQLHERFVGVLLGTKPSAEAVKSYYYQPDRRFVFGTLSWQAALQGYTYEFWEGDKLTPELLRITDKAVKASFFAPVRFKTNATWHQQVGDVVGLSYVTQEALIKEQNFMTLNPGTAIGRLKIVATEADLATVGEHDIIILKEVPLSLPPVAAVINERPSTILSHVNLLTKGWGVPNMYLKDASKILASMQNQNVLLTVDSHQYSVVPSSDSGVPRRAQIADLPRPNLIDQQLRPLAQLRAGDSQYCGSKAANLGAIKHQAPALVVPDGFCIPFAQFQQFMDENGVTEAYLQGLEAQFAENVSARREGLAALRARIVSLPVNPQWVAAWTAQWQRQLGQQGVFVRSSSNSEDLPNFSGAGLYQTVPNVTTAEDLALAVKTVWASAFNFEAYEARRVAGFGQDSVKMSVFVQQAIDADASGVMVTLDPFDETRTGVSYIAAKKGIGIRVVEGKKIAEQVLYTHRTQTTQLLSYSADEVALQLDEQGGVIEVALAAGQNTLLDDATIKRLAEAGEQIKALFKQQDQDIEWALKDGQVIVLQARPYLRQRTAPPKVAFLGLTVAHLGMQALLASMD